MENKITCPKCGFNKVHSTCLSCGYKFKPGVNEQAQFKTANLKSARTAAFVAAFIFSLFASVFLASHSWNFAAVYALFTVFFWAVFVKTKV